MDSRIDPLAVLGLRVGQSHVLRNAGARVTDDVLRSLVKSVNQLGVTRIVVMHHSDCGAAKIVLSELRAKVTEATGNDPAEVDFHLIDDPDAALHADVEALREPPVPAPGHRGGGPVLRRHDRRGRTDRGHRRRLTDRPRRPQPVGADQMLRRRGSG